MSDRNPSTETAIPQRIEKREWVRTVGRCLRYLTIRSIVVFLTVLVGVYAAIWVTNLGGFADAQRKKDIEYGVRMALANAEDWYWTLPTDEREARFQVVFDAACDAADLGQPFFLRSFRYFRNALTFSLGKTVRMTGFGGTNVVREILWRGLPLTLLLFGAANILTFFGSLFIALRLSRRYGSFLDRAATLLVPAFAAPPWFHGIFLILIFASIAKVLPFGGIVGVPLPETTFGYALSLLKHMILPVSALVLGTMPYAIYANRSLFMIHSSDDYVELAMAKGLGSRRLHNRYILRPVLPPILTNFALIAIVSWQGVILTEYIFNWPGLGKVLIEAIRSYEVAVVIGAVTMFAYLLGASILLLDVLYVLVDPRVTLGTGGKR